MEPLFHNYNIRYKNKTLFFKKWIDAGFTRVFHLIKYDKRQYIWKELNDIESHVGKYGNLMFEMFQVLNAIPKHWKDLITSNSTTLKLPILNLETTENRVKKYAHILNHPSSKMRTLIVNTKVTPCGQAFWNRKFGIDISRKYDIALNSVSESRLRLLHFKICHNIWPTNIRLHRMKLIKSEKCEICREPDFLEHFFVNCSKLKDFWKNVFRTINSYTTYKFNEDLLSILFGITQDETTKAAKADLKIANSIILIGKLCISKMRFGHLKDLMLIFDIEFGIRKESLLRN